VQVQLLISCATVGGTGTALLGGSRRLSAGRRAGESVQVRGGVGVQLQHRGQRVEHLRGRMVVAALFQPQVIVAADAREQRQFLAAKARDPAPPARGQADVFRLDELAPCPKVGAEPVAAVHTANVRSVRGADPDGHRCDQRPGRQVHRHLRQPYAKSVNSSTTVQFRFGPAVWTGTIE